MWSCYAYGRTDFTSMDDLGPNSGGRFADRRLSAEQIPCVRLRRPGAILSAMSTESDRIPAKPTLDGLEDKWTQRWAKERVVQV